MRRRASHSRIRPEGTSPAPLPIRLPLGVRDYLPDAAALRLGVVRACLDTFEQWGYRQIVTPVFEYADVLAQGSDTPAIRFVEPTTGEVAALRPDITPQVARLVATRLGELPGPIRLSYEGSVLRLAHGLGQRELSQVGVELIDAPQPEGDAEGMALACEAVARAGVTGVTLDVGHIGFLRAALEGLGGDVREALGRKDAIEVERLLSARALDRSQRRLVSALPRLHGERAPVLKEARKLASGPARRAVDELDAALEAWSDLLPRAALSVDLGEVRGFGYYTGVRFAGFAAGHGAALFAGGRYDDLCGRYGRQARATGFAIEVDAVAGLLDARKAPGEAGGIVVGGTREVAPRVAAALRRGGERAALLSDFSAGEAELRGYAVCWGFARALLCRGRDAVWIDREGRRTRLPQRELEALLGSPAAEPTDRRNGGKAGGRSARRDGVSLSRKG